MAIIIKVQKRMKENELKFFLFFIDCPIWNSYWRKKKTIFLDHNFETSQDKK